MQGSRIEVLLGAGGVMLLMLSALLVTETSAHSHDLDSCRTDLQGVTDFQQEAVSCLI